MARFLATSCTAACVNFGKAGAKLRVVARSSCFLGFPHQVLESLYLTLRQCPWGLPRLIHSSTDNDYYCYLYLYFYGSFLEAFSPPQAASGTLSIASPARTS